MSMQINSGKKKSRLLSYILVFVMVLSLFPVTAFADETSTANETSTEIPQTIIEETGALPEEGVPDVADVPDEFKEVLPEATGDSNDVNAQQPLEIIEEEDLPDEVDTEDPEDVAPPTPEKTGTVKGTLKVVDDSGNDIEAGGQALQLYGLDSSIQSGASSDEKVYPEGSKFVPNEYMVIAHIDPVVKGTILPRLWYYLKNDMTFAPIPSMDYAAAPDAYKFTLLDGGDVDLGTKTLTITANDFASIGLAVDEEGKLVLLQPKTSRFSLYA
ncbi:MAG: hypothetical protein LBU41_05500, partial [Clostridiales Family XIII bacterium]|nr:hypothetical protein [Clostridiales Family XIII bacterium]